MNTRRGGKAGLGAACLAVIVCGLAQAAWGAGPGADAAAAPAAGARPAAEAGPVLLLVKDGASDYVIVLSKDASPSRNWRGFGESHPVAMMGERAARLSGAVLSKAPPADASTPHPRAHIRIDAMCGSFRRSVITLPFRNG